MHDLINLNFELVFHIRNNIVTALTFELTPDLRQGFSFEAFQEQILQSPPRLTWPAVLQCCPGLMVC